MKSALLLAGLLAGLLFLERAQTPAASDVSRTHRALMTDAERAALQLTGFVLTDAGRSHEYRRSDGSWRCVSAFGAIANPREVTDLSLALFSQPAAWRSPALTEEKDAGFGFDGGLQIDFMRSDRDAAPLSFQLGSAVDSPAGRAVFIRRRGLDGVWELDAELLKPLLRERSAGFPPLLDQRLTAGCVLDPARGIGRAFIDFHDGASLELRPKELEGELRWVLLDGAEERPLLPYRFAGWLSFLQRAPYAGFVNPGAQKDRGLDPPVARVTLFPPEEAPIELVLGREVEGEVYLLNKTSGMVLLLPPGWGELIAPGKAQLTTAEGANPWENWLR